MRDRRARNHSYIQELSPICIKIKHSSVDLYNNYATKLSKRQANKNMLLLSGMNSEEHIKPQKQASAAFKNPDFSSHTQKFNKLPIITLPRIADIYSYSFVASNKPLTDKPKVKKYPSKKLLIAQKHSALSSPRMMSPIKRQVVTKVGYKDAVRFPDWAMIARPEIESLWRNLICLSNGCKVVTDKGQQYKYYVGKGNNSTLIKRLLDNRNWWVSTENILEAHFVWTQWKDKTIVTGLPEGKDVSHMLDTSSNPSIIYQVPVKMNDVLRRVDLSDLGFFKIKNSHSYTVLNTQEIHSNSIKIYNKLEFNQHLANKKGLYKSLKSYHKILGTNIFSYHPVTFHIKTTEDNEEFASFMQAFNKYEKRKNKKKCKNIWIVKPGENSNRGNGIKVCKSLGEIKEAARVNEGSLRTFIVQKYIEKPFLLHGRKFDIRCYALVTSINGVLQGYFYNDGYLRTSCAEYNLKDTENSYIHLTNDAIQKHAEDYGKFEDNNKLSYKEFQRYLDFHHSDKKFQFFHTVLPQIKTIVKDTISSVFLKIDTNKRLNCMEIFGYDFMLDHNLKPWIIEVNTNPCLELSSSYLSYLIPTMVDNAFRIALDCNFPSSLSVKSNFETMVENRFDLIFHELIDGAKLKEIIQSTTTEESDISDVEKKESVKIDSLINP